MNFFSEVTKTYFPYIIVLYIIGLVLSIITAIRYSKDKAAVEGTDEKINAKPHIIRIAVAIVCFVIAQVLLILNQKTFL